VTPEGAVRQCGRLS